MTDSFGLLNGSTATVSGNGATAGILERHLAALGAEVRAGRPDPRLAASAQVHLRDGRRRDLAVTWGGPVREPSLVDEATVQAVCGLMHVHGRRDGRPTGLEVDYCGAAAGVLGVTGLLASLLTAPDSLTAHTSVAQAALLSVSQYLAVAGADGPEAVELAAGGPPFTSSDGIRFELDTLAPETWAAFWTALGAPRSAMSASWRPFQFRYATATATIDLALHRTTRAHTFAAISSTGADTGMSICRLYTAREHARELADWSRGGPLLPWQLESGARPALPLPPPPGTEGQPLTGLTVLEAGRRVQAPLAAHLLGLLGARVTRIEPPGGDPLRGMPPSCGDTSARWLALNRGKDAVEVDIKNADGRDQLRALAGGADVFLHNWAPGKAEQLGLGSADLPGHLVYTYTSAWGAHPVPDPPLGTDFMVQARTGMAELTRPADTEAAPSLMTLLDVFGGLLGAEATVAGLVRRSQSGVGVAVQSSLLDAAIQLFPTPKHTPARPRSGFRRPTGRHGRWSVTPDDPTAGPEVAVTTDLAALLDDPRFTDVIGRDNHGAPALTRPWRFA